MMPPAGGRSPSGCRPLPGAAQAFLALDRGRLRNYVAAQEVNHDEESTQEVGDEAEEGPAGSRSGREEAQAGGGRVQEAAAGVSRRVRHAWLVR